MIEHVPTVAIVTVVPDTVQTGIVVEAKLTGRPELALAEIASGVWLILKRAVSRSAIPAEQCFQ